jgi:hypothetical protein
MPLKILFQKKEMANFRYDDDVLLKWEITGIGKWEGSYSHFNSMMKRSMKAEQSDNEREPVLWGKQFAGKNKRKCCGCGRGKVWVLRNETLTRAVLKLVR